MKTTGTRCLLTSLVALFITGIHLPALGAQSAGNALQFYPQNINEYVPADQLRKAYQCSWKPPSFSEYPEYYSSGSPALSSTGQVASSAERTVESVHRIVNRFHVVRRSDGSGGLDENLISAMMNDLNYGYRDTPFVYVRHPELVYVDNDEYYADFPTFASAYPMLLEHRTSGIMNWFITPKIRTQVAGTWIAPASPVRGILMRYDTTGTPSFMRLPVHEMAHIFQVLHLFETVFGIECSSGSNCASAVRGRR